MKLHLVRHGKAEISSDSGKDFDRRLAPKGIAQSQLLGKHLLNHGIKDAIIVLCSDAARTRQTLQELKNELGLNNISYFKDLYLCSKEHLLDLLWSLNHGEDLLLVGHNFGISDLGQYLVDEFIELKTGEYLCIEFEAQNWNETSMGTGTISHRYRASVDL